MDELDRALRRAWEIAVDDLSDATDGELETLLPRLVEAGYVRVDGESPTGYHWRFTREGVARVETLVIS